MAINEAGVYMGYTLNKKNINVGKKIKLSSDSLSDVYMINRGIALRVYKDNIDKSLVLSKDDCEYLSNLRSDRILLPKKLLYKNNNYCGYSFRLLNRSPGKEKMISTDMEDFISDIEMLEEDIDLLSRKRVMLDGITPNNIVYSDGLYLTDASQFKVLDVEEFDYKSLRKLNDYQVQLLIESMIVSELRKEGITNSQINDFIGLLEDRDSDLKQSKYYTKLFEYTDNIRQFVKRI